MFIIPLLAMKHQNANPYFNENKVLPSSFNRPQLKLDCYHKKSMKNQCHTHLKSGDKV